MINGFPEETGHLTGHEIPIMKFVAKRLQWNLGKANKVKSTKIIKAIEVEFNVKLSQPRLRKIINFIRTESIIPFLVAASDGYWVETDEKELNKYIEGLRQRADAITNVADIMAMNKFKYAEFLIYENHVKGK